MYKRDLKTFGRALVPALAVTFCFLLLCLFAAPLLTQNTSADREPLRLAVVNEDTDARLDLLLNYATGGGLFDELLRVRYETDGAQAQALLKSGGVDGVLVLPQNFLQSFLDGANLSVRLLTSLSAPAESLALSQLVPAAETMLETGQGGVWAVLNLPQVQALPSGRYHALYREVNLTLLRACLEAPQTYLTQEEVPLSGTLLPLLPHYFTVFYIFFALLSGCFFTRLFTVDKEPELLRRLSSLGVGPFSFLMPKLLFFFFYQLCIGFAAFFTAAKFFRVVISLQTAAGLIGFALLTAALCLFLFSALDTRGAVLASVLLGFLGLFCTGGLLPPSSLPSAVQTLGSFLPAGLSYSLLAPLCGASVSFWPIVIAVALSVSLVGGAAFLIGRLKKGGLT